MRRREKVDPDGPPLQLRRFVAADWVGRGCHPECAFWQAVWAWADEHPDRDVEVMDGPDVPWHPELIQVRRRESVGRPATPEGTVRLWAEAQDEARVLFTDSEERRRFVAVRLAEHGVDVVDAIRARRALRSNVGRRDCRG